MTDHAEEQEMEAEALQAIFDTHFTILEPQKWQIEIFPEMTADADELQQLNHVGVHLIARLPDNYPEEALPVLDCQIIKGLVDDHRQELLALAQEEAQANEGVPSIFAIAERLREWLAENNQKGLDDLSMHAQMLRKQQAKEKEKQKAEATIWESQEAQEEFTAAELEEMAVRKRRAEGTPCNKENFEAWKARFEEEMADKENDDDEEDGKGGPKKIKKQGSASVDRSDRMTGFDYFRSKATNMEALEAAAEAAETQEMEPEELDDDDDDDDDENEKQLAVDEDLFEDDVDLDDLDFDDEDDDEDVDI